MTIKFFAHTFSLLFLCLLATLVLPHVAQHGIPSPLLLKICVYTNVFLHGSHFYVCVSYLKRIPGYILKQVPNNVGLVHLHHFHFLVPLYS